VVTSGKGYGARVLVVAGKRTQVREITPVGSYLSSNDPRVHFGLGAETKATRVEIQWPDGSSRTLENVPTGPLVVE